MMHLMIRTEHSALKEAEVHWERMRVVRTLLSDGALRDMLGVSDAALEASYLRVHKDQKAAETKHFGAMEAVAQLATERES